MTVREQVGDLLNGLGVDRWGFADLSSERGALNSEYGTVWDNYPRAVSLLMRLPLAVCEEMQQAGVPTSSYMYYYDVLNARLNDAAMRLSAFLEDCGWRAYPIPASQRMGDDKLAAIFSHRLAARLAGLGWIGKSCCLINPDFGPRHRLVTVLTDAPFSCDEPIKQNCGTCRLCADQCPAGAILGEDFNNNQPLKNRFNGPACDRFLKMARNSIGKRFCGRCIVACPVNNKTKQEQKLIFYLEKAPAEQILPYSLTAGLKSLQKKAQIRLWEDQIPEEGLPDDALFFAVPPALAAAAEATLESANVPYRIIGRLF
ncbi:MAG: epoxyqueuosine reductase [Clostridia bacterium]|nr:epoxyqueuosine reductase [Clostridia bacterium]MDD4798344.1 epoxyqueuosine reductase [Clostridia bacterium]